ncbi:MAG: 2-hydroxychromene-2-carboxylate isomerase-like protein [Solirubrobacteraceae bacterium]|nr:2-hydroxychromene-2-carboxylate isomerase-like protein [Solirubrobacteraceae bacterium]
MGELISLTERRRLLPNGPKRRTSRGVRSTFSFDLALPETYLAAERVDRRCDGVRWQPASVQALGLEPVDREAAMAAAEERAITLGLPLIWPDPFPCDVRPAMRAAALACELGRGAAFVLAASRLAYCGGFNLSDPEVLAEAAAAASVPLDECLAAAGDVGRDIAIDDAGHRLRAMGADALPTLRVGRLLFSGESRLPEALAALAAAEAPHAGRRPAIA